jgi:hypothetical protein
MSNTLQHTNGESWKTYWDKIEKPEREKVQVREVCNFTEFIFQRRNERFVETETTRKKVIRTGVKCSMTKKNDIRKKMICSRARLLKEKLLGSRLKKLGSARL